MPEWMWRERRMWDLIAAVNRYHEAGVDIPGYWMLELKQRVEEFVCSPVPRVDFDSHSGTDIDNVRCGLER